MSDKIVLGKRRTVRFEAKVDGLLAAKAAAEKKSVSELIRDSVLANLQGENLTAADWILSVAGNPSGPDSPERQAFRKKYLERHRQ